MKLYEDKNSPYDFTDRGESYHDQSIRFLVMYKNVPDYYVFEGALPEGFTLEEYAEEYIKANSFPEPTYPPYYQLITEIYALENNPALEVKESQKITKKGDKLFATKGEVSIDDLVSQYNWLDTKLEASLDMYNERPSGNEVAQGIYSETENGRLIGDPLQQQKIEKIIPTNILSYIEFAHRFNYLTPESIEKLFTEMPTAQTVVSEKQCAEKAVKAKKDATAFELPEAGTKTDFFDVKQGILISPTKAIADSQEKIKSGEYMVVDVPVETQKFYDISQLQISAVEFQKNFPKQESPIIIHEASATKEILLDTVKAGGINIAENSNPKNSAISLYDIETNTVHYQVNAPEIEQISALVTGYSQAAMYKACTNDIGPGEKDFCSFTLSHLLHSEMGIDSNSVSEGLHAKTINSYSEALKNTDFSLDIALSRCEKAADFLSERMSEIKSHHVKNAPAQSNEQQVTQKVEQNLFRDLI